MYAGTKIGSVKAAVTAALLSTLQGCLGLQPAARTVHGARSVARGAHCSDRHQRLHRAPCAASTLAVHSSARHALQLRAASRCSVACALPETAQGCGSVRSTLLERCCWPAVHVVRWGFVGRSFQRTARTVNFYYFRSSVHLLAPCTPRRVRNPFQIENDEMLGFYCVGKAYCEPGNR